MIEKIETKIDMMEVVRNEKPYLQQTVRLLNSLVDKINTLIDKQNEYDRVYGYSSEEIQPEIVQEVINEKPKKAKKN